MHYCQRVILSDGQFAVIQKFSFDYKYGKLCGKPAFYKQAGPDLNPEIHVELWLCVDCFNEYEGVHGKGSWEWDIADYAELGHWDDGGHWHRDA